MESTEAVEIFNAALGKVQIVKNLRVRMYEMPNKKGEPELVPCVEYLVVGHNREWVDWQPYEAFLANNPKIEL